MEPWKRQRFADDRRLTGLSSVSQDIADGYGCGYGYGYDPGSLHLTKFLRPVI